MARMLHLGANRIALPAAAKLSAERARRLYGLVYPRNTRSVRFVFSAMNLVLRLLRKPVRGFVHPVDHRAATEIPPADTSCRHN